MIDRKLLARLVPINGLGPERVQKLLDEAVVEPVRAGREIFQEGDQDAQSLYLLEGKVLLSSKASGAQREVQAGSDEANYALSNLKPRQYTGKAVSALQLLRVDSALLDSLLAWDQLSSSGIVVEELDGDAAESAWTRRLFESRALLRLPSANLDRLFSRFEEIPMKAGQIVIRQGEPGDYYYAIKQGRCRVVHKPGEQQKMVALADLTEGDSFGEEALLAGTPRNATIAALTDGLLMRLAKQDFLTLLTEPLVERVSDREAVERVRAGAGLIDVRLEAEFRRANLKGSVNIPLARLRSQAGDLDRQRRYVVYCDTGRRSTAAAFLLSERGFEVAALKDGINALIKTNPAAA